MTMPVASTGVTVNATDSPAASWATFVTFVKLEAVLAMAEITVCTTTVVVDEMVNGVGVGLEVLRVSSVLY
jgi:hypothetical protein